MPMAVDIYVISGFLGAGKTTLIQKLLKETFQNEKVVLIENDFGEISVDAALFNSGSVEVKEINSGCICCSLSGDFVKAVKEIIDRFQPNKIIIEPSGVGKLSDIIKACEDPGIRPLAAIKNKITVVDVKRGQMYLDNFGEFFEDQIKYADLVLLSRTEQFPARVNDAYSLIKGLNAKAAILAKPWGEISAEEILFSGKEKQGRYFTYTPRSGLPHPKAFKHNPHRHSGHDHEHCDHEHCNHNHAAEEVFDTITIRTKRRFTAQELKLRMDKLEQNLTGTVLRAKGILSGPKGWLNLQYLPGDLQITNSTVSGDMLCFIGRDLNRQELAKLFGGE